MDTAELRGQLLDAADDPKWPSTWRSGRLKRLDLAPMVSNTTDHDNINAPMLLRTRSQRAADSGFGGVERSVRRAVVSPGGAQPAPAPGPRSG